MSFVYLPGILCLCSLTSIQLPPLEGMLAQGKGVHREVESEGTASSMRVVRNKIRQKSIFRNKSN